MNEPEKRIEKRFQAVSASKTFGVIRKQFDLESRKVLDIGCSYGEHLTHFGPESAGITLSSEAVAYARRRGLKIIEGNIEDDIFVSSISDTFDVIFANNLFEHLYSPHAFLINVKKLLKKDGLLILGVPCLPKITSLTRINKFHGSLSDAHINFFVRDTLRLTVERAGWVIESARSFKFTNTFLDSLVNIISPHIYVVARVNGSFDYSPKRKKELKGYIQRSG